MLQRWPEPFLPYLLELTGLRPTDAVLDIGCGLGRVARELRPFLAPSGSYTGMDVQADRIEKIRPRYARLPNFAFVHADVRNSRYNADGTESAAGYRFPAEDDAVGLVILRSVFTHLLPDEVRAYMSEIARVLRPGGRSFVTYFLVNDESRPTILAKRDAGVPGSFPYDHGLYWLKEEELPERGVALDETFVRELHPANGLHIVEPVRYGSWCRPEGDAFQDVVVAEKP